MSLFVGQSFVIKMNTGYIIQSPDESKILFTRPDNTKGSWDAVYSSGLIIYNVKSTDINMSGTWIFQAYIKKGEDVKFGELDRQPFLKNIK